MSHHFMRCACIVLLDQALGVFESAVHDIFRVTSYHKVEINCVVKTGNCMPTEVEENKRVFVLPGAIVCTQMGCLGLFECNSRLYVGR